MVQPRPADREHRQRLFAHVLKILDLRSSGEDHFTEVAVDSGDGLPALFGGRVVAQALRATTLTIDPNQYSVHSIHAHFLRPGRPGQPVEFSVKRVRDGRSFATRSVVASQDGKEILTATTSFHRPEVADEWPPPGHPAELGEAAEGTPAAIEEVVGPMAAFDVLMSSGVSEGGWVRHPYWIKAPIELPPDAGLHASLLTYISDMGVVWSSRGRGTLGMSRYTLASLDHGLWFHRPVRVDEWLRFEVSPMVNHGARGFGIGTFHTQASILVASVAQESLQRPPTERIS